MSSPVNIDSVLPLVRKPARYSGGEYNAINHRWDTKELHFCLVFPDLYEIGMSHQGLQILYHILNEHPAALAHRCFAPDLDLEAELHNQGMSLFSLEARRPLRDYEVIGFTLPYELCYTNILTILASSDIPFYAAERGEEYPILLAGGSCALNPEPVADFFDVIVLGDGEEVILDLTAFLLEGRRNGLSKREMIEECSTVSGVYVPSLFQPRYDGACFAGMNPLREGYHAVHRRVLPSLPALDSQFNPLVPIVKPVHDRLGVEVARGCTRGCRFCQAGMTYRPVRERSVDDIMNIAKQGISKSGFNELALLSLSSGDFSCLGPLLGRLMDHFSDQFVSVSMPSMRVGTLTPEIMQQIKRVRKTGFTVAPEAGTDRLREVINKGITEEDLLATCRDAFSLGWKLIKFYFMIGLPTETEADVDAIVELACKAKSQSGQGGKRAQINVSVATFVPKPHTPFQWAEQLDLAESQRLINRLKKLLPRNGFKLKWHDPKQSFLEGVFSRGDRRLAQLLVEAWQEGARLDGWTEHFSLQRWQDAADRCGIDLQSYLRERSMKETLPWDHLHCGVDRSYLDEEYQRSLDRIYTPDCRVHGCQGCGLCDFKTLQPVVNDCADLEESAARGTVAGKDVEQAASFSYRVHYSRLGDSRFYGHLELLQMIFRVLRRAHLPILFSKGFNPSPRVSFSQALPVGMESHAEYFDMELSEPLKRIDEVIQRLNEHLPETIQVSLIELMKKKAPADTLSTYEAVLPAEMVHNIENTIPTFLASSTFPIVRIRKGKQRELDLRKLVKDMYVQENVLVLQIYAYPSQAGTNPREILEKVFGMESRTSLLARITKIKVEELCSVC